MLFRNDKRVVRWRRGTDGGGECLYSSMFISVLATEKI